jgi:aromatase
MAAAQGAFTMRNTVHTPASLSQIDHNLVNDTCLGVQLEYSATIMQRADKVFDLLVAVDEWPTAFEHCRRGTVMGLHGEKEVVEIIATTGGREHAFRSIRSVRPDLGKIEFQQLTVHAPIIALSGYWQVTPTEGGAVVTLCHEFTLVRSPHLPTPGEAEEWVRRMTHAQTRAHLAALKTACERDRAEA